MRWLPVLLAGCAAPGQVGRDAPSVFAPGIVSGPGIELNAAFSPDGRDLYFSRKDAADKISTIFVTYRHGDAWSEPAPASFSGHDSDVDPMLSPDGTRLYFSSYRPRDGGTAPAADADLWFVERRADGFGEPVHLAAPLSTPLDDLYPSLTHDGALYYARWDAQRETGDLFVARAGREVAALPAPVNTESVEYDPFIAPDESYLVFVSSRPGGHGGGDLYISFRNGTGWSAPRNLGPRINTNAREYAPVVSPDGTRLFFSRKADGRGDVYWLTRDAALRGPPP